MSYIKDVKTFQKNVTTSGTPVQLNDVAVYEEYQTVLVKAKAANTGTICVGYSSATALNSNTDHFKLSAGQSIELRVTNTKQIWIDSTVNGEGVEVFVGGSGGSSGGSGSGSAGTEYTEGATDTTITGQAILWEDTSDTLRAVSATKPLPVEIKNALEAVDSGGAEADSIGAAPFRRTDSFKARFNGTSSTSVQEVKAATASKKHHITDCVISTDTAQWVAIVDGAASVILGPYYMPANSVLPLHFNTPVQGSTNTALNVDCGGSSGNVTVDIAGYTI